MSNLIIPKSAQARKYGVVSFIAAEKDGLILVIDLWGDLTPDAQRDTSRVTDAPQTVITELLKRGYLVNDWPLIYLDEDGIWDWIQVRNGSFDGFRVLHADSYQKALAQLLSAGVLSAKDLKREPVVNKELRI